MLTRSIRWSGAEKELSELSEQLPGAVEGVLIQVFWGRRDRQDIPELQRQLRRFFPDAAVIGTTTAGEIMGGRVLDEAVVVSVSCFERAQVTSRAVEHHDMHHVGRQLASALSERRTPTLMIAFLNGHLNGEAFARGVGDFDSDLPLAGGLAGDGVRFGQTWGFDHERLVRNGAVAAGLYGELHYRQHFNFNWQPIGPKFTITRAEGNLVHEINNMPARAFYARYLGDEAVAHLPAIAMEFPLVFERHGQPVARACLKVLEDGAMLYAGEVPQGQKAQFGVGAHHQILQDSCRQSRQLAQVPVESIFIYSCVARRQLLQQQIEYELRPLEALAPTAGFFTYGELAHLRVGNTLLNQTMTLLALSESNEVKGATAPCREPEMDFRDVMLRAMAHLSTQVSADLERLSLKYRDLAEHDLLTGLYNRRAGERLLHKEMARARRHDYPLTVAMLDMDHFKRINDAFGHAVGDQVLRHWARFLVKRLRHSDHIIRWGGEELLLILPMTDAAAARARLTQLMARFRQTPLPDQTGVPALTFSGGVSQMQPQDAMDALIDRADQALYRAKASGRARIE